MLIVFIGPPGAGKGTQSALLTQRLGVPHVSTGDLLREARRDETEIGKTVASYLDRGDLVPDEVIVGIVVERLAARDCKAGCLLDGFPRNRSQAESLDAMLHQQGRTLDVVVELSCDDEEIIRRLVERAKIEGRADDTPETMAHRQRTYRNQTEPILAYYREKGLLHTVDGMRSRDGVFDDIWRIIESTQSDS